jgi:hypothetical protein
LPSEISVTESAFSAMSSISAVVVVAEVSLAVSVLVSEMLLPISGFSCSLASSALVAEIIVVASTFSFSLSGTSVAILTCPFGNSDFGF